MAHRNLSRVLWIIGILVVAVLWLWNENAELKQRNVELENRVSEYAAALTEANDHIEEANSTIEEAQAYAWSTYQEMGEALENMSTVDAVSEP